MDSDDWPYIKDALHSLGLGESFLDHRRREEFPAISSYSNVQLALDERNVQKGVSDIIRGALSEIEARKLMRERKRLSLLIIIINIIGVICLIYFAIPYFTHNTTIPYSDAMLPAEAWDRAGMILTFGFIPLLAVNILNFIFVKVKKKFVRFLFFAPSAICLIIVVSYWLISLA